MTFRMAVVVADGTVMGASLFGSRRAYTKCISNARRRQPKQLWQLCAGTVASSMSVDLAGCHWGIMGQSVIGTLSPLSASGGRIIERDWRDGLERRDRAGFLVRRSDNLELRTLERPFLACLARPAAGRDYLTTSTGQAARWTRLCDTLPSRNRSTPRRLCEPTMRRSNSEARAATV